MAVHSSKSVELAHTRHTRTPLDAETARPLYLMFLARAEPGFFTSWQEIVAAGTDDAAVVAWAQRWKLVRGHEVPQWVKEGIRKARCEGSGVSWSAGTFGCDRREVRIVLPQYCWDRRREPDLARAYARIKREVLRDLRRQLQDAAPRETHQAEAYFTWTVWHQFCGLPWDEIAKKWGEQTRHSVDEQTVKNEVTALKRLIGIGLPGGRPRASSSPAPRRVRVTETGSIPHRL
jgi:hypothetical protein